MHAYQNLEIFLQDLLSRNSPDFLENFEEMFPFMRGLKTVMPNFNILNYKSNRLVHFYLSTTGHILLCSYVV